MKRAPRQLELTLRTWGGRRPGAGRKPKGPKAMLPHRPRPDFAGRYPVHVTLEVRRDVGNLRTKNRFAVVRRAFCAACLGDGFRITDWSVQRDHIHLIVEARGSQVLARGIKGFSIRVAKGLNALLGRKGAVFADRYHAHILRTPKEVRHALCYVMLNARHHGVALPRHAPDPCSSWDTFDGWRGLEVPSAPSSPPATAPPKTWLRTVGWRRHRLIDPDEVPGGRP